MSRKRLSPRAPKYRLQEKSVLEQYFELFPGVGDWKSFIHSFFPLDRFPRRVMYEENRSSFLDKPEIVRLRKNFRQSDSNEWRLSPKVN